MATGQTERELLELEKRYWQALKDKDVDAALQLTDFPCIVTGPQGVARIDRQGFAAMMTAATYTLRAFELKDDAEVRMLGDDIGILVHLDLAPSGSGTELVLTHEGVRAELAKKTEQGWSAILDEIAALAV